MIYKISQKRESIHLFMKKKTVFFIFILICISQLTAQNRNYNIGILVDESSEELLPLLTQLKSQIQAVVGEDATISFPDESYLVNNYNLQKAEQNYQSLLNNNTDIILAYGAVNNIVINEQKEYKKPTILFGSVNQDMLDVDLSKATSGISNFTYIIDSQSFKEDLSILKDLTGFKNVGIVVEEQLMSVLPLTETLDRELNGLDASYKLIGYKTIADITSQLQGIDAVYLAGGFFLSTDEIKSLAKTLIVEKIPSFTSTSSIDVQNGLLATNQNADTAQQFFRRVALNVEAYISGKDLSELPVYIEYPQRLTINYNTANATNVPIKYSLIDSTDFVGTLINTFADKKYNLVELINDVLNNNLSLEANERDVNLSEQDLKTAKNNYLPNITADITGNHVDPEIAKLSFGQNPEFSTNGNVTLRQTVFSEEANANIGIQKELLKAQQENFNSTQLDAIFNASNVYFNTLILKSNAYIQLRNLNLTKRNLQIAKQNFEAGASGKSDMLRFKSEMAQNTQAMIEAINMLEQGFIAINQLTNTPLNTKIDVENVELGKGVFEQSRYDELTELLDNPKLHELFTDFLVEEAMKNAPELKALDHNLNATERQVKFYGAGRFLPTVAVQGGYNYNFNRSGAGSDLSIGSFPDGYYNIGASISLPIFNQNNNNVNKQTALIQKDQLDISKNNLQLNIEANIRNGVLNLINQISNIELSKVAEEAAQEGLELTQTSYSTGAVTVIQLIDAQNNYLNAQLASTNAVYNFLLNALQLERYLGFYFLLSTDAENENFKKRFFEYVDSKN